MDEELKKIHEIQLELAKEVKRICEKHNIKYFLDSGTLLGAVRHKGFIPWDDDLDIGFLREEYERFIKIAPVELSSEYFLQTWDTELGYGLPFGKIRMNGTKFVEKKSMYTDTHKGIFIDIFPYDNIPDNKYKQEIQGLFVKLIYRIILVKSKYTPWEDNNIKKLTYYPIKVLARFFSKEMLKKHFLKWVTRYNKIQTEKVVICDGASFDKWKIHKQILTETTLMKFEDTEFSVPINYDKYLKQAYGDYMTLPPEDKRHNRHGIIEIRFKE